MSVTEAAVATSDSCSGPEVHVGCDGELQETPRNKQNDVERQHHEIENQFEKHVKNSFPIARWLGLVR